MSKGKRLIIVWLPVIIAISIALGIFIGNHYTSITQQGRHSFFSGGNKISAILNIIEEQYVDTVNMAALIEETIPQIFNELDPHSLYISADDAQAANEDLEGSFSGIGVSFNMQTDTIIVISVIPGGPAEKAGIQPFDRIITINDSVYSGKNVNQTQIIKTLRGEENSTVKLGVQRSNQPELISFVVTRGSVPVNSIDVSYLINKDIGYIKISKFARTTYNEFLTSIAKLKQAGANSFVIDLRGNTGGYMDAAVNMINEFMPRGELIVYTEGKSFPRRDVYADGSGTCKENQIVVLTDEISASASEIFAGAIQDNDRGVIVGRRTFGKGLVQAPIQLNDGSEIRLTIARYYTPSGRSIQKTYQLGHSEDYEMDIYNRFEHGEFDHADSIKVENDLKYETNKGRIVYGGGGIMPDIFIPRDTSGLTSYFTAIANNMLHYLYALDYSDKNRDKLSSFETYQDLHKYLKQQPLLEEFTNFAVTKGVKKRPSLIEISGRLIEIRIHAYIVRNFFEDEGFYPIFQQDDVTLNKAVQILSEGRALSFSDFIKKATDGGLRSQTTIKGRYSLAKERTYTTITA